MRLMQHCRSAGMSSAARSLRYVAAVMVLAMSSACSTYRPWINSALPAGNQQKLLPSENAVPPPVRPVLVAVALSGGGARAAAFGLGVLRELKATRFTLDGQPTTLLDHVALISGVSGGSILAAYYAAFGDETLTRFEPDFLLAPFEWRMIEQALTPTRLYRLTSPWYGRSHVLAQRLDELYGGRTFGDVKARPGAPDLMITATDLTTGAPFDFTPDQFGLICSDLDRTPLSFAVASSSAVPILLSPMTLRNYAGQCKADETLPQAGSGATNYRIRMLQRSADGYRDTEARPYIHLVDGGVTDNLGVRLMLDRLLAGGSIASSFPAAPPGSIRRLILVAVNSERDLAVRIDKRDAVPTTGQVLESLLYGAGARDTQMTLAMLNDDAQRWRADLERTRGGAGSPFAADAEIHVISVSLHDIQDSKVRHSLLRVPTAFTVESSDVRDLETAGAAALRHTPSFRQLKESLHAGDASP